MYLSEKEFTSHRIQSVREQGSLYDLMDADGHPPRMRERSAQIPCCFMEDHPTGRDNKPSARYYPSGERGDYETYYCWVCTPRPVDVIGYIQRTKGMSFFHALRYLESMYGIRYDDVEVAKDLAKELDELNRRDNTPDVKRLLSSCEAKLLTIKNYVSMSDYADLSYVLDKAHFVMGHGKEEAALKILTAWKSRVKKTGSHTIKAETFGTAQNFS